MRVISPHADLLHLRQLLKNHTNLIKIVFQNCIRTARTASQWQEVKHAGRESTRADTGAILNQLQKTIMKASLRRPGRFLVLLLAATVFCAGNSLARGTMGRWEMCGLSGTPTSVTATGTFQCNIFYPYRGAGLSGQCHQRFSSTGWSTSSTLTTSNNDYYTVYHYPSGVIKCRLHL